MRTAQWVGEGKRRIISRLKGTKTLFCFNCSRPDQRNQSLWRGCVFTMYISLLNALINICSAQVSVINRPLVLPRPYREQLGLINQYIIILPDLL